MVFSIKNLATASTILSVAQGAVIGKRSLSGEATTYGGNTQGGACSFSTYTLPSNIFGTALSDSNWDTAANCGRCVSVTGPAGNSIVAMITDECPGCGTNHLDLYPTAFTSLGSLSTGILDVTWDYVSCPITTPLELHNKEGVSANWFSMQVVNANEGVSTLEVSTDGGSTWGSTTRTDYNFFEYSAGYGSTVDIKVTSLSGAVVTVNSVSITSGSSVTASSNFGSGSSSGSATSAAPASSSSSAAAVEATSSVEAVATPSSTVVAEPTTTAQAEATSTAAAVVVPTASSSSAVVVVPTSSQAAVATSEASPASTPSSSLAWAPKPSPSIVYVYDESDDCDA